jgi:hypothetical protein
MLVSRNLVAFMGLLTRERRSAEMQALSQVSEGFFTIRERRFGPHYPIEAGLDELLEGGFPLGGNDFCAVEQVFGEVNGRLHGP